MSLRCRLFGHPGWQSQEIPNLAFVRQADRADVGPVRTYPKDGATRNWTKWRCPRCGEYRDSIGSA